MSDDALELDALDVSEMLQTEEAAQPEVKLPFECNRLPTRVVTVRIPPSLHQRLTSAAHFREKSINQLCQNAIEVAVSHAEHDRQLMVTGGQSVSLFEFLAHVRETHKPAPVGLDSI